MARWMSAGCCSIGTRIDWLVEWSLLRGAGCASVRFSCATGLGRWLAVGLGCWFAVGLGGWLWWVIPGYGWVFVLLGWAMCGMSFAPGAILMSFAPGTLLISCPRDGKRAFPHSRCPFSHLTSEMSFAPGAKLMLKNESSPRVTTHSLPPIRETVFSAGAMLFSHFSRLTWGMSFSPGAKLILKNVHLYVIIASTASRGAYLLGGARICATASQI